MLTLHHHPIYKSRLRGTLYELNFLSSLCASISAFYFGTFGESLGITGLWLGSLFAIGSLVSIVAYIALPKIVRKIQVRPALIIFASLYVTGLYFTAFAYSFTSLLIPFIVTTISYGLAMSVLDMYVEVSTDIRHKQGSVRGTYLALSNLAYIVGPLTGGLLIQVGGFPFLFLASILFMIPFLGLVFYHMPELPIKAQTALTEATHAVTQTIVGAYRELFSHDKIRTVFYLKLLSNLFTSTVSIFVTIYMIDVAGFSFATTGLLLAISLIPYVLIEIPVGKLVDGKFTEHWPAAIGFFIIALCISFVPIITDAGALVWAIILFVMRIGGSLIEISTESFFFKHLPAGNTEGISGFRALNPLSLVIAPILASVAIYFGGYNTLFTILSVLMLHGTYISIKRLL
jgi:MFS family permease